MHRHHPLIVLSCLSLIAPISFAAPQKKSLPPAVRNASATSDIANFLKPFVGVYTTPMWKNDKFTPDGPILGNGDMHVVLVGDTNRQSFAISQSDMWTDGPGKGSRKGKPPAVCAVPTGGMDILATQSTNAGEFRQEQSLLSATVTASSKAGFKSSTIVATSENVMITRLWTDGSTEIPIAVELWAKADAADLPGAAGVDSSSQQLWATRETRPGRWVSRNGMALRILGTTPTLSGGENGRARAEFSLKPNTPITIITVLKGGKNATQHRQQASERIAKITPKEIEKLTSEHASWWQNFYSKSYVKTNDPSLDKFYYGSLYQFACINRSEFLPAGQYPFCLNDVPGWLGDYHLNQEYLGQNEGFFSANRSELSASACQPLFDLMPVGRDIAANRMKEIHPSFTPRQGICFSVGMGPWGVESSDFFGDQVSNASYTGALVIWQYQYFKDKEWLRTKGYPFIRGLADFWVSHLVKENGKYHSWGASWEHGYGKNPVMDLGTCALVMRAILECSQDLNVDAELRPQWQDILNNLADFPTVEQDGKRVFVASERDKKFRNYVCLEHVYPGECLSLSSPANLREIAINSIDASKKDLVKYAIFSNYVGYPFDQIVEPLKKNVIDAKPTTWNGLRQNMTVGGLHYCGEFIQFINSAMLQSHEGFIRIFPNWSATKPGEFVNLRAKGAFIVSAKTENQVISPVSITSEKGLPCSIHNPWGNSAIKVTSNGTPVKTTSENQVIRFETKPNTTYLITKG